VVVHNLYVVSVSLFPYETDAPLIVDADTVLARAVAFEGVKSVTRGHRQIDQSLGCVEH
jgi:hypothetical protein